jgi:hypothetical protein
MNEEDKEEEGLGCLTFVIVAVLAMLYEESLTLGVTFTIMLLPVIFVMTGGFKDFRYVISSGILLIILFFLNIFVNR